MITREKTTEKVRKDAEEKNVSLSPRTNNVTNTDDIVANCTGVVHHSVVSRHCCRMLTQKFLI